MSFMNSYKQLEKLCNEIYHDNHGVSSYIDDMTRAFLDSQYIITRKILFLDFTMYKMFA